MRFLVPTGVARTTWTLIVSWMPACTKRQRWISPAATVSVGCTTPLMLVKRPLVSQMVGESSCSGKLSTTPGLTGLPGLGSGHVHGAFAMSGTLLAL